MSRQSGNPILDFIMEHQEDLIQQWTRILKEIDDRKVSSMISAAVYDQVVREFIDILIHYLRNPDDKQEEQLNEFSSKVVQLGWSLHYIVSSLKELSRLIYDGLTAESSDQEKIGLVHLFDKHFTPLTFEVIHHYASSWERTVTLQRVALQELSAPLIPVFDNITVMPLIGTIDTERAKRIMENLLQGVVKHRAEVVLIDITGVPVVDTMVAHHVIQAAEAVRLVGAKCLLVGIRPEIAQTIVNLGINLEKLITKNTLQKGIESALEMTDRKIVSMGEYQ
ncbi:STAS domain-containing protein [Metabacillus sp. GX 13764]|uniref:STAS domain-containing protein n=1 Tax=Metabacillus kandeliae TaxID=2900151 RepID=UPI001E43975B|nr:STAS domain-containing protein [Metabacillus kandeliae]MCD7036711.1 STAS domain-containing protein [Metabacillus kandeliae]